MFSVGEEPMRLSNPRDILVVVSLCLLAVSVLLAAIGFPQALVTGLIGAVGAGARILWDWLDRSERKKEKPEAVSVEKPGLKPSKAAERGNPRAQILLSYEKTIINEAITIGGKRRHNFQLLLEEGQDIQIVAHATEGRYSIGLMSLADFKLQQASGKYDMEWYVRKGKGKQTRRFRAVRRGTWYLSLWSEESYTMEISVKVLSA